MLTWETCRQNTSTNCCEWVWLLLMMTQVECYFLNFKNLGARLMKGHGINELDKWFRIYPTLNYKEK